VPGVFLYASSGSCRTCQATLCAPRSPHCSSSKTKTIGSRCFRSAAPAVWNSLPSSYNGVTFDKHFNFDKHISNVCSSSYINIRALRHIRAFLDSETSKTIACAVVGSRLDYVPAFLLIKSTIQAIKLILAIQLYYFATEK